MARLILLLAFILSGCSAQWHLKRAIWKDPTILESTEVRFDTIIVTPPKLGADTFYLSQYDTIIDTINGIKYQLIRQVDTFNLAIECPQNTIKVDVVREVPQVRYQPTTWWQRNGVFLLSVVIVLLILYNVLKNK